MLSRKTLTLTTSYQLLTLVVALGGCWAVWREGVAGVLLGGMFMAVNFWALRSLAERVLFGGSSRRKLVYGLVLALKMVAALAILALILAFSEAHAVGLVLGMATLFAGMAAAVTHQAWVAPRNPVST